MPHFLIFLLVSLLPLFWRREIETFRLSHKKRRTSYYFWLYRFLFHGFHVLFGKRLPLFLLIFSTKKTTTPRLKKGSIVSSNWAYFQRILKNVFVLISFVCSKIDDLSMFKICHILLAHYVKALRVTFRWVIVPPYQKRRNHLLWKNFKRISWLTLGSK